MGPTALLPLRRSAEDFFRPKYWRLRPGTNPWTWVPKASTLPLDHRSRLDIRMLFVNLNWIELEPNTVLLCVNYVAVCTYIKYSVHSALCWSDVAQCYRNSEAYLKQTRCLMVDNELQSLTIYLWSPCLLLTNAVSDSVAECVEKLTPIPITVLFRVSRLTERSQCDSQLF
jgi:hypothetical protein